MYIFVHAFVTNSNSNNNNGLTLKFCFIIQNTLLKYQFLTSKMEKMIFENFRLKCIMYVYLVYKKNILSINITNNLIDKQKGPGKIVELFVLIVNSHIISKMIF